MAMGSPGRNDLLMLTTLSQETENAWLLQAAWVSQRAETECLMRDKLWCLWCTHFCELLHSAVDPEQPVSLTGFPVPS